MHLRLDYDPRARVALIATSEADANWVALRHILQDASAATRFPTDTLVAIPWWAFLSIREPVKHLLQRSRSTLEPTDEARAQLLAARDRERSYENMTELPELDIVKLLPDKQFVRHLSPDQAKNVRELVRRDAGATFSVPGAGKTTEALAFFFVKATQADRLLVIAPINAFAAWEEQLELCAPGFTGGFKRLRGGEFAIRQTLAAEPRFSLINYQQFLVDGVRELVAGFVASHPTFVFLDESHRIKGGVGKPTADAVLTLAPLAFRKLIMSGTPMPNAFGDLVPQFRFLYPEIYVTPETVVAAIKPIFVRTTKAQLRLPPVNRIELTIPMSPPQRELYNLIRSEAARQANQFLRASDRAQLRRLGRSAMKLLQTASNPALLARDVLGVNQELLAACLVGDDSPKVAYACKRARALAREGKKSVIWTSFVENVELIASRLADLGADFIHGRVDTGSDEEEDTREYKIRRFHEEDDRLVLVANPAAAGEGISLHSVCHNAIYVDRNYNAAQYLQSEDRIHRFGVTVPTFVEILTAEDSIDSAVSRRLQMKVDRMARVLNDPSLSVEAVSLDIDVDGFDPDDALDLARDLAV